MTGRPDARISMRPVKSASVPFCLLLLPRDKHVSSYSQHSFPVASKVSGQQYFLQSHKFSFLILFFYKTSSNMASLISFVMIVDLGLLFSFSSQSAGDFHKGRWNVGLDTSLLNNTFSFLFISCCVCIATKYISGFIALPTCPLVFLLTLRKTKRKLLWIISCTQPKFFAHIFGSIYVNTGLYLIS